MPSARVLVSAIALVAGGCGEPASVDLSSADVHGSARLSSAERTAHVNRCVGLKHEFLRSPRVQRSKWTPDERFDEQVARACDCVVNGVEDRASKMQFLIVMGSLGKIKAVLTEGKDSSVTAPYEAAALKHGMSATEFAIARRDAGKIADSAIINCGRFAKVSR